MNAEKILEKFIKKGMDIGLERVTKSISKFIDIKNPPFKIIHIAGTNGKGTTANLLNNYFEKIGKRAGLFTSPHIESVTERIKIGSKEILENELIEIIKKIEKDFCGKDLTYFEILNVAGLYYFLQEKVEFVILETGLGGRLDSTNATNKFLAIITHIDYDHINILGNDILGIFKEKFAICENSSHFIIAPQKYDEINHFVQKIEDKRQEEFYKKELTNKPKAFEFNYSIFYSVVKFLSKNNLIKFDENILEEMKNTQVLGRMNITKKDDFTIIKDVSHNLNGIENLVDYIQKNYQNKKFDIYFSALEDKNYVAMVNELSKIAEIIYFHPVNSIETQRFSVPFEKLISETNSKILREVKSLEDIKIKNDTIFCGSFYLISKVAKI